MNKKSRGSIYLGLVITFLVLVVGSVFLVRLAFLKQSEGNYFYENEETRQEKQEEVKKEKGGKDVVVVGEACGKKYPIHENITSSVFWVGEASGAENDFIPNDVSAWDNAWQEHFGGVDDPEKRNGYSPSGFVPKENPFYIALPYNEFDANGKRKNEAERVIYWSCEKENWEGNESMLKNRWVKIWNRHGVAYAQWEDAGPFVYDDYGYVFGHSRPRNKKNEGAGIDVSPAVRDYLKLAGLDKVSWQFVSEEEIPNGPWKEIVTTSGLHWK